MLVERYFWKIVFQENSLMRIPILIKFLLKTQVHLEIKKCF